MNLDSEHTPNYYEELGRAHDYLLRCKDCQSLVGFDKVQKIGCCDHCGNKRFAEITILSEQEMADIQSGAIDFPDRDKFLKEFSPVEV